jgi:hypothetical protein
MRKTLTEQPQFRGKLPASHLRINMEPSTQHSGLPNFAVPVEQLSAQHPPSRSHTVPKQHVLLQFFTYGHLPEHLRTVSKQFAEVAQYVNDNLPSNSESTTALRKLLEAKDCAVRSVLFK